MGTALEARAQIIRKASMDEPHTVTVERLVQEVELNSKQREVIREQGEFIQKLKRDIRDFLGHPSLGSGIPSRGLDN